MGAAILPGRLLRADDERWEGCRNVVVLGAAAADDDLLGIGGTPWSGDFSGTGLLVPTAATNGGPRDRYLLRLCGVEIPPGAAISIKGIKQLATIRHTEIINEVPIVNEREVVSPNWRFLDGNISWHLRLQPQQFAPERIDPAQLAGESPSMRQLDTSLLYLVSPAAGDYVPPNGAEPPGTGITDLGTWRDMRFPWDNDAEWNMDLYITGPGAVVFYASVLQTDPNGRPPYPDATGMRPEDQFVSNFPTAVYGHVAGAMIFEMMPCCDEKRKRGRRFPPGRRER